MELIKIKNNTSADIPQQADIPEEITEKDYQRYLKVISTELTSEQRDRITTPEKIFPKQHSVLAVHWHPEYIPMKLISERIETTFPKKNQELIIPTQHNVLLSYGDYSGVEVDCYSRGFNQKVQLLLHFANAKVEKAEVLKAMLAHTFQYRSSQLFDFIHTIIKPREERLQKAAGETGADENLIAFVRTYVQKIHDLLEEYADITPEDAIKNQLLRNYFDLLREDYGDALIERAQTFLKAVKKIVKDNFSLGHFYRTSEIIEEARSLGAGVVIPHPEQFWPILLAEYDVDGYEVWNPQSRKYTEFLISVVNRKNCSLGQSERKLLIFMGDDTHMSEKAKDPEYQKPDKANREIGYQPAWDDLTIRKQLIVANTNRQKVIQEYRDRLDS